MRVLTYCVTAALGAAQTLRRGFASVSPGHITLLVSLAFDRFRGSADQPEWPVRRTTTFSWELAPRQFSSLSLFSSRLVFQFNCSINVATLFLL